MVPAFIFWMVNEFKHVPWIEGLVIFVHPDLCKFLKHLYGTDFQNSYLQIPMTAFREEMVFED
jgi:hypothetical protein